MPTMLSTDAEYYTHIVTRILVSASAIESYNSLFEIVDECESIMDDIDDELKNLPIWALLFQAVETTRDLLIESVNPR